MLNVSNDFNEAYKNYEREIKMRIKINGVMYTDHDISSFSVDYGSFMGNSFGIGSTFTNSMKLTLCKIVEGLKQLDEVVPEMGIVMPDKTVEYVPLGVFVISEEVNIDRNDNKTVIECSDRMILMNEPYESKLKYPAPIRDVALEISNLSGMEVDKTSFSTIKRDVIDEPKNYTYREALGLIAQFMAGYMTFDRNGLLTIRYLVDKDYRITPKEYMLKGLDKNEILFRPAGIEVRTGQNEEDIMTVGKRKGSVIKLENTVMRRLLLDDMYTRIKDINFYPYTLKWRGNPAVEVGDWLRVTDTKGNVFKVPNLSYRLEYRGGLIATSTVETVASNEVKMGYRGVLDQTIHYVNNILEDGTGNHIYYGVEKPEYPKEGDTWFKKNGPDTEIYIYQKIAEPDVFDWVLQISSAVDDTIKEAIEELEKDVQNAKDKADEVAVGLVEVQKDADEAKASAEQSKLDAQKALAESEVTKVEAQKAKEQSDKAIKDASTSMINAKEALDKATTNETSIGGLQVDIDKTNNELKTKANQSDLNTLKGTVTNQQTQITQNATDIKTKAEKTYVDTINNKVDKQQSQINQNSESIKLKAEKQEVTNLKNELDSLEYENRNYIPFNPSSWEAGWYSTDGIKEGNAHHYRLSKLIDIESNRDYIVQGKVRVVIIAGGDAPSSMITHDIKPTEMPYKFNSKNAKKFYIYIFEPTNPLPPKSEIETYKIKLEKGNRATDWTPAPEDMATAGQVKDLSASIDIQAGQIELKADQVVVDNIKNTVDKQGTAITQNSEAIKLKAEKSQVDGLTGKVDKQQTEINQNAEQIKLKANQSVVNDIGNKVTNQQAQINLNSENIKLKAEKSEVSNLKNELDGLEIGGTNLFTDTSDKFKKITIDGWNHYPNGVSYTMLVEEGQQYVVRAYIKNITSDVGVGLRFFWYSKDNKLIRENSSQDTPWINSGKSGYFVIVDTAPSGATGLRVSLRNNSGTGKSTIEYRELKVEKGNKPTAWSPAPEDLATQSDVTKLEASINVEAGKITNLTSSVNKNSTEIGKLTIESNKISSQVVELQNQEIGGGNLIPFTDEYWEKGWYDDKGNKIGDSHHYRLNKVLTIVKNSNYYIQSSVRVVIILVSSTGETVMKHDVKSNSMPYKFNSGNATNGYIFILEPTNPLPPIGDIKKYKIKLEKSDKLTDYSLAVEDMATQSQITQLSDDILLRVQKGDVINQINISTEGVLIQGKKIHITGQTKIDNAVIKDAMIANVSANKLTAGTINANEIAVINIKAENIVANTLSSITTNTGTLNISGWLNMMSTNVGLRGDYDFGDEAGIAFPRWYTGDFRLSHRHLLFSANSWKIKSNGSKGAYHGFGETFYGANYFKSRWYKGTQNSPGELLGRIDIRDNFIQVHDGWSGENNAGSWIYPDRIYTPEMFVYHITARPNTSTVSINEKRAGLGEMRFGSDGSGAVVRSKTIYNRTYSWTGGDVTVLDTGTLGRLTSASKYKLNIEKIPDQLELAKNILKLDLKKWHDKESCEIHAKQLENGKLDKDGPVNLASIYGLIAEDVEEAGLEKYCQYNSKGEIEGIAYDKLATLLIPLVKDLYGKIEVLENTLKEVGTNG